MQASAEHIQLLLMLVICGMASSENCRQLRPNLPCGCTIGKECAPDVWSGEDKDYYYLDDMAFRKLPGALTFSDYTEPNADLNPMFWPGGLIFYVIDDSFASSSKVRIRKAMTIIQNSVGEHHLEFHSARTSGGAICRKSYLMIERTEQMKCIAEVGGPHVKKLITKMWINENQCSSGTIQHELLHSLGRMHEQSRLDRDEHVTVMPAEMYSSECKNFFKSCRTVTQDPSLRLPYDVNSIMQYGSCFFSCTGKPTMLTASGENIRENRKELSALDIQKVRVMYPANAKVPYSRTDCSGDSSAQFSCVAGVLLSIVVCFAMRLAPIHFI